jgi:hypothetical protein
MKGAKEKPEKLGHKAMKASKGKPAKLAATPS